MLIYETYPSPTLLCPTLLLVYTIYYIQYLVCYMVRFWRWKMKMRKYILRGLGLFWRWENRGTVGWIRQKNCFLYITHPHSTKKLTSSLRTRYQIRHGQTLYCCFSTHPPPIRQNSKGFDTWLKTFFDKILLLSSLFPTFSHNSP